MSEPRRTGVATVSLVVEVDTGTWGPDCTLDQLTRQARKEAVDRLHRLLTQGAQTDDELQRRRDTLHGVRIVKVQAVAARFVEDSSG